LNSNEEQSIEHAIQRIFPKKKQGKLIPIKNTSKSSTWKLVGTFDFGQVSYFVKAMHAGEGAVLPSDYLRDRVMAAYMSSRVPECTATHFGFYILDDEEREPIDVLNFRHGLVHVPIIHPKTILFEVQKFIEGTPFSDVVEYIAKKGIIDSDAKTIIQNLCAVIKRVTETRPDKKGLSDTEYVRYLTSLYNDSLLDIRRRIDVHVPLDMVHPIISERERMIICSTARHFFHRWQNRYDRLRGAHGDLRMLNIILDTTNQIKLIDFSRLPWADLGYDIGRLLQDIRERYFLTGKTIYLDICKLILDTIQEITQDEDLNKTVCFGLFSMMLIKLNPKGKPITDQTVAKKFFEENMAILDKGQYP